jgi:hypothetical protein
MSQIVEIVSEDSPTKNLGESSDAQALHAHFCPIFQPIFTYGFDDVWLECGHREAPSLIGKL